MCSDLKLKLAAIEDLPFIESLLQENQLPHQDISEKLSNLFIGSVGEQTIGIGGLEVYRDAGLLRSLAIESSYRGKGYGKAFTAQLLEFAKSIGIEQIYLLTTTAVTFFTQLGFEKVDRSLVPSSIQNTSQFTSLCPASAICLLKEISI
jgi:amino-acid N-acetyltransferase